MGQRQQHTRSQFPMRGRARQYNFGQQQQQQYFDQGWHQQQQPYQSYNSYGQQQQQQQWHNPRQQQHSRHGGRLDFLDLPLPAPGYNSPTFRQQQQQQQHLMYPGGELQQQAYHHNPYQQQQQPQQYHHYRDDMQQQQFCSPNMGYRDEAMFPDTYQQQQWQQQQQQHLRGGGWGMTDRLASASHQLEAMNLDVPYQHNPHSFRYRLPPSPPPYQQQHHFQSGTSTFYPSTEFCHDAHTMMTNTLHTPASRTDWLLVGRGGGGSSGDRAAAATATAAAAAAAEAEALEQRRRIRQGLLLKGHNNNSNSFGFGLQQQQMSFPSDYPTSLSYLGTNGALQQQQQQHQPMSPTLLPPPPPMPSLRSRRLSGLAQATTGGGSVDDFALNLTTTAATSNPSYYYCLRGDQRELGRPLLSDRGRWNGPQDLPNSVTDDLLLNLDLFRANANSNVNPPPPPAPGEDYLSKHKFQSLPRSLVKAAATADRPVLQDLLINNESRLNDSLLLEHKIRQQRLLTQRQHERLQGLESKLIQQESGGVRRRSGSASDKATAALLAKNKVLKELKPDVASSSSAPDGAPASPRFSSLERGGAVSKRKAFSKSSTSTSRPKFEDPYLNKLLDLSPTNS